MRTKMNKYQEALDRLTHFLSNFRGIKGKKSNKQMAIRPKITLNNAYCGKCGEAFGYARASHVSVSKWTAYCPVCGQKQDWSEDE